MRNVKVRFNASTPTPAISPSTTSLSNFTSNLGTPSASQTVTVNGTNLTADITATAPAGFEVSTDDITFDSTATIAQTDGNPSATLYVRLAASASVGTPSGNITLSSDGATDATVAVSGNVTAPLPGVPVVTGASFNGTVGVAFSEAVSATNDPDSYAVEPALPEGLTLDTATGAITGTPTAVGNASVVISATNGNGTGNGTFTFAIAQGTPSVATAPSAAAIRLGQALADSALTGGAASVNGTFAFTDPTIEPVATGNQSVTFTPEDSVNYTTATLEVEVVVNPPPVISVTPESLSGFSTKENAASANQTMTFNGTDLEGPVTVTAPAGYEVSRDGITYSSTLAVAPDVTATLAEPLEVGSDSASNYGTPESYTWGDGADEGTGFGAWGFSVDSDGTTYYAGAFVGDPATAGIVGLASPAFGLYANPGGTPASATVSRSFDLPMRVGDSFSFQWATKWDSDVGNKGFNLFAGGEEVLNVNQGGFPGDITVNGEVAIDGESGYGDGPMTWTITRDTETNLLVTSTARDGSSTVAFTGNVTIAAAPEGFSFYTSAMGAGDERQPYFDNLRLTTLTSPEGDLNDTILYVRLAANGTPGVVDGNLTFSSANATDQTVALSGIVIALTPPVVSEETINGEVGVELSASVNATNSPTALEADPLPTGIEFDGATGVFSGTPASAGNFTVGVTATNADGTGSGNLTFAIAKGTPTIVTPPTASLIYIGQSLALSTLSGGNASVPGTFAFTDPTVEPPTGNDTQSVTFTPTDGDNWNTREIDVAVEVSDIPPDVPGIADVTISATVGEPLSASVNATYGPTSHGGNLPDGLVLDSPTGEITGTPWIAGNYTVAVTATNIVGSGSGNLTFQIAKGTPVLVTPPSITLYPDESLAETSPIGGLADIAGEFAFVDPTVQPSDGQSVDLAFTPYDTVNWNATTFTATATVESLPVFTLTINANLEQITEGDPFSEARIRLSHDGPVTRAVSVNFTSSPTGVVEADLDGGLEFVDFPAEVVIPVGSNSTSFYVRGKADGAYTGISTNVTLTGTGRFLGAASYPLTLSVMDGDSTFGAWSGDKTPTESLVRDYAIGGAAFGATGETPLFTSNGTHAELSAIVRTGDNSLSVTGETTSDLVNEPWTPVSLDVSPDQSGVGSGFSRMFMNIPLEGDRIFLRLRVELE